MGSSQGCFPSCPDLEEKPIYDVYNMRVIAHVPYGTMGYHILLS